MNTNLEIRAIIVDDEASSIRTLAGMLESFCPNVSIQGSFTTINGAAKYLSSNTVDVVFLDVELPPNDSGFDLLEMIPNYDFEVIFATAYESYAVQAINEIQPFGFLLKPFVVKDIMRLVNNLEKRLLRKNKGESDSSLKSIIINDRRKGTIPIKADDIVYCHADRNTTDIYYMTNGVRKKMISSYSLKKIESNLNPLQFCRTHHAFLINLKHVQGYKRTGRNGHVFLSGDSTADISVLKMESFEKKFREYFS